MKVRPARNFVMVKEDRKIRKFKSILLPEYESGLEKVGESSGIIEAVSGDYWIDQRKVDCPVKPGDRILFKGFLSNHNLIGEDTFLLHHTDIMAIIPDDMEVGPLSEGSDA